jgi:cytochrome c oxidase subunit 2
MDAEVPGAPREERAASAGGNRFHDLLSVFLAVLPLILVGLAFYFYARPEQPDERVVAISASRVGYAPSEVTVRRGEPVVLEFTTVDTGMAIELPDFNVRTDIVPGKRIRARLIPGRTGTVVFRCDRFCGAGEHAMNGKLRAVD